MTPVPERPRWQLLFIPAMEVMNRLSYARKFIFILLVMTGPMATLLYLQVSQANHRYQGALQERAGLALVAHSQEFLLALERARVLAAAAGTGLSAYVTPAHAALAAVESRARSLDDAVDRGGSGTEDRAAWQEVRAAWNQVRDGVPADLHARDHAFADVADRLHLLTTHHVGNFSGLVVDPELDSFWLMSAAVAGIPELMDTAAQAGTVPLVAPGETRSPEHGLILSAAGYVNVRARAQELATVTLPTAYRASQRAGRSRDLGAVLEPAAQRAQKAVQELADAVRVHALESPGGALAPAQAMDLVERCLDALAALDELSRRLVPEADGMVAARAARDLGQLRNGVLAGGGAALVLAYLFIAFYLSVRQSFRMVSESSQTPVGEEPKTFVPPSHDEMGAIASAFNRAQGEKQRLEEQLKLADRLATIGQLASGTAHELNEPLGAVLGFAQLALKAPGLPEQAAKDLGKITKAALHAREIIKQLMLFARQSPPSKEPLEPNQVVEEALELVVPRAQRADVELVRTLAPDLPPVTADRGQLKQVIINLVVNAVQASAEGRQVTISTRAGDGQLVLLVEDQGTGMSQDVLSRIFLPFYTTKEVGQGTGLGLSVVHGIVTAHGGNVHVDSVLGLGTRVEVRLPLAGGAAARPGAA